MRQNPQALEIYRHFKGNYYQIVQLAVHTETEEELVIYRPMYDNDHIYARPLAMFMSEVDHEKYPEARQRFRFEKVDFNGQIPETQTTDTESKANEAENSTEGSTHRQEQDTERRPRQQEENLDFDRSRSEYGGGRSALIRTKRDQKEYTVMDFLDADTYEHKLEILRLLRNKLDDSMINTIAVSLDLEPKGSSIEEQYEDIRYCLTTLEKYECNRLR